MHFFRRTPDKKSEEAQQPPQPAPKVQQQSSGFGTKLKRLLGIKKALDPATREELEEILLLADTGIPTTEHILQQLDRHADNQQPLAALTQILESLLVPASRQLTVQGSPWVILIVGSNGVGKTTTIAKMAYHYQQQGYKPLLAAGDTFRAAAVEQLHQWAQRLEVPLISQSAGADSASVIFDAISSAKARNCDLVLADTAGRLQNKTQLLDELEKIKRVAGRAHEGAPHETLLVIDATTGQNAVHTTEVFHTAIGLTGLIMTKLDGSAKGGTLFSICHNYGLPVPFIGTGEQLHDFQTLNPHTYVHSLLA